MAVWDPDLSNFAATVEAATIPRAQAPENPAKSKGRQISHCLITGASGGLGAEFTKLFARDRRNLVLCSSPRSRTALMAFADRLRREHGIQVHALSVDLAKPGGAEYLIQQVEALNLEVDTLVNNAGAGIVGLPLQEYDALQFTAMLQLNVMALS